MQWLVLIIHMLCMNILSFILKVELPLPPPSSPTHLFRIYISIMQSQSDNIIFVVENASLVLVPLPLAYERPQPMKD